MSLSSADVVCAVRLLSPHDLKQVADLTGAETSHRMDVVYKCVSSRRARRALLKFLFRECQTPRGAGIYDASGEPPSAPRAPPRPRPACCRRLNFDAVADEYATVA
jgi:hypothetical protein